MLNSEEQARINWEMISRLSSTPTAPHLRPHRQLGQNWQPHLPMPMPLPLPPPTSSPLARNRDWCVEQWR
jgi:hypothetical protein